MKTVVKLILISIAASSITAGAVQRSEFAESENSGTININGPALRLGGIYQFLDPVKLIPKVEFFGGVRTVTPENYDISFLRNEPVAVEFLKNGDAKITLLLADGEKGEIPEEIIVSAEEFSRSGLRRRADGDAETLKEKYSPDESVEIARRGGGAYRRGRMHYRNAAGGSYYGCVASVCASIGGCTGSVGNGVGMTGYLKRTRGWRRVSCSNPPIGAVASWSGGSGAGHTGRWNGRGWCYDKGCGDPGRGYHLRECVAP
jgi:hypothetical protein